MRPEDLLLLKDIIFITADITSVVMFGYRVYMGHIRLDADAH